MEQAAFHRVLVKLGGEALQGTSRSGLDAGAAQRVAGQLASLRCMGVQLAVVVGAGNIVRGGELAKTGFARTAADAMGMIATGINALALKDALERSDVECRVIAMPGIEKAGEPAAPGLASRYLDEGKVVVFAGGTGNPYFSTDTAAVVRAMEIGAEIILKATKVDGVYDRDPVLEHGARRFRRLTYRDMIRARSGVMDLTAVTLCMENRLPVMVVHLNDLERAVCGQPVGTIVADPGWKPGLGVRARSGRRQRS